MVHRPLAACFVLVWLLAPSLVAQPPKPTLTPLERVVDLTLHFHDMGVRRYCHPVRFVGR